MPILPMFSPSIRGSDATVITSVVAAPQHYSLQPAGPPHAADASGQQPRVHRRQRAGTGGPGWPPLRLLAPLTAPAHPSGCAAPWPRGACRPGATRERAASARSHLRDAGDGVEAQTARGVAAQHRVVRAADLLHQPLDVPARDAVV